MRTYTQPLSRELDRAVYMTERHPRSPLWRGWVLTQNGKGV